MSMLLVLSDMFLHFLDLFDIDYIISLQTRYRLTMKDAEFTKACL